MKLQAIFLICCLLLSVPLLEAQSQSHYCNIKIDHLPAKSGKLAFSYKENNNYQICYLDFASGEAIQVYRSDYVTEYASLSPDGKQLIFYSDQNGDREIYSIKIDGSEIKQLTSSPGLDEDPSWSPDGKKIVFSSGRNDQKTQNIFIMNNDGSEIKSLTSSTKINSVPRWSPSGDLILYSTSETWPGWDLAIVSIPTKEHKFLTKGILTSCRGSWNLDGSAYVFSRGSGKQIDLYLADLKNGNQTQLTNFQGREYDAIFIDETTIAFVHESSPGKGDFQIYELNINTKISNKITSNNGSIRYLSWGNQ